MKIIAVGTATLAAIVLAPGSALAVHTLTSSSGADYTWNYSNNVRLDIHDGEADSHDVAGEWEQQGSSRRTSATNSQGGGTTYTVSTNQIVRHRVVELVPYHNDDYGPWKYPY